MQAEPFGIPTFLTRVERWQCDFNDHWNARFYARSFQMAAETAACLDGGENPGAAIIGERHMRFHRELLVGTTAEVRSAKCKGGENDGSVIHALFGDGRLAATALDRPGLGAAQLPEIEAGKVARLLPRNVASLSAEPWPAPADGVVRAELGPIRPNELDHTGALLFEELIARTAVSSHSLLFSLGYSMEFSERTGIGRMAAELSVRRVGRADAGTVLTVESRLGSVAEKSFMVHHRICTRPGDPIAVTRQTLLSVDLRARETVAVPDFMRR